MADADLTFVNAALTRIGEEPITSFTDGSIAATIAAANYEVMVKAELAANPWKIAKKIAVLNLIDALEEGDPPEEWQFSYQLPTDLVSLATVKVDGEPIEYALMGRVLFCNVGSDSELVAHYLWRVQEVYWPPWFGEGMTRRLEALFLRSIGERHAEASVRDDSASEEFAMARAKDAQQQTPRNPVSSPLLTARRGTTGRLDLGGQTFGD